MSRCCASDVLIAAFVAVARKMFPEALRPSSMFNAAEIAPGAFVHPSARCEAGVTVDPGAVIGPDVEIGAGTIIGANAVIGPGVRIGRDCAIGAGASVIHAIVGDRVIIHPGCRIGQDGFGYLMGAGGHQKVPQVGRVIIQDEVEIGAGTTIDRGAIRDTVIGEGTKIDNLVQIGHNVAIGRHCVIVAQSGISGSATIGGLRGSGRPRRRQQSRHHRRGRPARGNDGRPWRRSPWRTLGRYARQTGKRLVPGNHMGVPNGQA